jgi:hypothetical protein
MKMFLIILLILPLELSSQDFEKLRSDEFGFSIDKPATWLLWEKQEIQNSFTKFDFTKKEKGEILANNNRSVLVFSFARSKSLKKGETMIPLVQIYLLPQYDATFDDFEKSFVRSIDESVRPLFKEFEYLEKPSRIKLDGKPAVSMLTKTKLLHNGIEVISKSRVIAVPKGSFFFQISLIDGYHDDDCQELYLKIIDSIKIDD